MTKFLLISEFWPFVKPLLFWKGDTADAGPWHKPSQGEYQPESAILSPTSQSSHDRVMSDQSNPERVESDESYQAGASSRPACHQNSASRPEKEAAGSGRVG